MAWVYILRGKSGRHYIGSTEDLQRRLAEHQRGSNHTTRRLGGEVELVANRQLLTMVEARALELQLKRKKNPEAAVFVLQSSAQIERAAPKAFGVGSGFESQPTQAPEIVFQEN
jgi:predicted GIY-YIG superfamily endonuclease